MTTAADVRRARAVALLRDGAVTLGAVLLSYAAFDDITTGHETDFTLEYAALLVAGGWLSRWPAPCGRNARSGRASRPDYGPPTS